MKNLILVVLAFVLFFFSCGKAKNTVTSSVKDEKKTEVKKDSIIQEKKEDAKKEIKKYEPPTNKTVYVDVLPEDKSEIAVSKLMDWLEKDINNYLDLSYTGSFKGDVDSEGLYLEKSKDGKIVAKYIMDKGEILMTDVRIEGNNFFAVLTLNNLSEEFNGKFVKFKAPVKGESEYINGLLINRKGVWKFLFQYV